MENEKRNYRQTKREIKRAGNRGMRNFLKRQLRDNPSEAHWDEYEFGEQSTEHMNGRYPDNKRKREEDEGDTDKSDEDDG